MSATSITVSTGRPSAGSSAGLAALPVDLSHSPVLGIVGVILGAGIVTLTGRLLTSGIWRTSKGMSELDLMRVPGYPAPITWHSCSSGHFQFTWEDCFGPRMILLYCAAVFTAVSAILPLVHNYDLLIGLLAVAGLTSGTFYPLTLTFALKSIPLRYLALVIALYATCIEAAVNFAPSIYGFCRNDLSWQWMFWIPALHYSRDDGDAFIFGIPHHQGHKARSSRRVSSDFFISALVSHCCLPLLTRDNGLTGGDPVRSRRCSRAGCSSCSLLWCVTCAAPTFLWIFRTCASGTQFCWR